MKPANPQLGTVPCPFAGCAHEAPLFKYQPREDGRRSAFTGKWYAVCPDHGRIGGDGSQKTQDYLIEKGKVWGAGKRAGAGPENPEKPGENPESSRPRQPVQKPENPEPAPVPNSQKRGLLDW